MSIWLHGLAGGLQGLGTSITTADAEKREARGMALREKYLAARQAKQHTFTSEQGQLDRDLRSTEGSANRKLQTDLTDRRIASDDARAVEGREHDLALADIRGSNTMKRLEAQLAASAKEGNAQRTAAMERTKATIGAGMQRATAEGRLEQYNDLLDQTLERAGTMAEEFDAEGNPVTNWKLYDEMVTLTDKAQGVPPWLQPIQTADMIGEYASLPRFGGDVDAAVTWLKQRHYRVPEQAIAQAIRLATSAAGGEPVKRTGRSR